MRSTQGEQTCNYGCDGIRYHRPQLNLVGVFGETEVFDNCWQLETVSDSVADIDLGESYKQTKRVYPRENGKVRRGR